MDELNLEQKMKELGEEGTRKLIEMMITKTDEKFGCQEMSAEMVRKIFIGHEHEFVPRVTKEATCTEEGVMTYECECGEDTYTEVIPMIAHNYREVSEELAWNIVDKNDDAIWNSGYFRNGWSLRNHVSDMDTSRYDGYLTTEVTLDTATTYTLAFRTNIISCSYEYVTDYFRIYLDGTKIYELKASSKNSNGKDYSININIPAGTHQIKYELHNGGNSGRYVNLNNSTLKYTYTNKKKQCTMCGKTA